MFPRFGHPFQLTKPLMRPTTAALLKKMEALCLELGNRSALAYCYSNWGLLARKQRDSKAEPEKLAAALEIFTELNMPREREGPYSKCQKWRSK
jgi:hypothetical protein